MTTTTAATAKTTAVLLNRGSTAAAKFTRTNCNFTIIQFMCMHYFHLQVTHRASHSNVKPVHLPFLAVATPPPSLNAVTRMDVKPTFPKMGKSMDRYKRFLR